MAKRQTNPPKGTRDFLPSDVLRRDYVSGVIKSVYESHGYAPLETPSFERLDTLLGKYGEEGDQLVFKILHRGQHLVDGIRNASSHLEQAGSIVTGRSGETAPGAETILSDLGLRYDLTVPLARVYANYQGKLPRVFKRYQIQPVWRADSPGKGRFREFYQCDVDVLGETDRGVEAELCGATAQCMKKLGFSDFSIRLNHRALLSALVDKAGIPKALESKAIIAIDKLDKISKEQVATELVEDKGVERAAAETLLDMVTGEPTLDDLDKSLEGHEQGMAAIADLKDVFALSEVTPANGVLTFDASLARGLGYYTGAIFEIAAPQLSGSLGGGGRYDGLIGMFLGKDVPACGFSIGLERILGVMDELGLYPSTLSSTQIVIAAADPSTRRDALALSYRLRDKGLAVELRAGVEKPGKLRKHADESEIPYAAWLKREGKAAMWTRATGESSEDSSVDELETQILSALGR